MPTIFNHPGIANRMIVTPNDGTPTASTKNSFTASSRRFDAINSVTRRRRSAVIAGRLTSTMNGGS
jgi:hypothetical protein